MNKIEEYNKEKDGLDILAMFLATPWSDGRSLLSPTKNG
jgi:hypothetical protein